MKELVRKERQKVRATIGEITDAVTSKEICQRVRTAIANISPELVEKIGFEKAKKVVLEMKADRWIKAFRDARGYIYRPTGGCQWN